MRGLPHIGERLRVLLRRRWLRVTLIVLVAVMLAPTLLIMVFRFVRPPVTTLMLIRRAEGYPINQRWLPLDQISPALRDAAISSEDHYFCTEPTGFDFTAIRMELYRWEHGRRPTGASTITMQTARNLFLWPGRSVLRKVLEAWMTPQIALFWPHWRVLEVYLNVAEFGPGIYGAGAASEIYFHKPAGNLNLSEATLLVLQLPDPLHHALGADNTRLERRTAMIEAMVYYNPAIFECVTP
jgi:monofunctional glycosyltransferase